MSTLTKHQVKTYGPRRLADGNIITAEVRLDDSCGNGHNSFAITGSTYGRHRIQGETTIEYRGLTWWMNGGGCCHDAIAEAFPELAPFIRWHLCATDGPMHYLANAEYWAGHCGFCDGQPNSPPNAAYLRSAIVYGSVPGDEVVTPEALGASDLRAWLIIRLPELLQAFRRDVETLGLTY